jgi:hypothetical protein
VDSVSIKIVVDADAEKARSELQSASSAADSLSKHVESLSAAFSKMQSAGGDKLESIAKGFADINGSLADISKAGRGLSSLASGMEKLSGVSDENIEGAGRAIRSLGEGIGGLESIDPEKLNSLSTALSRLPSALSTMGGSNLGDMDSLKSKLDSIAEAGEKASKIGNGIGSLGSGLKNIPIGLGLMGSRDWSSEIESLGNVLGSIVEELKVFDDGAQAAARGVESFATGINRMVKAADAKDLAGKLKQVSAAAKEFVQDLNGSLSDAEVEKFARLADAIDKVTSSYRSLRQARKAAEGAVKEQKQTQPSQQQGQSSFSKLAAGMRTINSAFNITGNLAKIGQSAFNAMNAGARRYLSTMGQVASIPFQRIVSGLNAISHASSRLGRMAFTAVFYNGLFKALSAMMDGLQSGVENLYQWALTAGDGFASSMDSMASSVQYFKNSVGAAAGSLISSFAPALSKLIDYAVSAFNAVNQLFAALSGSTTWRKAVKVQKQFADAADGASKAQKGAGKAAKDNAKATDAATKAAKAYENTVLGFDELNKLNAVNDGSGSGKGKSPGAGRGGSGGGGGAGGGAGYDVMFENANIDDMYKDLAKTDDWTKLGESIADALNNWEKSIDWDRIDKVAATWSKRVWTAFNGFVHERDWTLFGYTIARGLNVGLHFVDDIAQHADFTYLGSGLAAALNKAIDTIDAQALGRVLTDKVKIALEMLHGFINGNDTYKKFNFERLRQQLNVAIDAAFRNIAWQNAIDDVTEGLGDLAETFASGISRVIWNIDVIVQNYDWTSLGQTIASKLNGAIKHIDFNAVGRFLSDGLKVAFEGLHGFVDSFDWNALGNAIETSFNAMFSNIDWAQAGTDVGKLADHILDMIEKAIDSVNWDDVNQFLINADVPGHLTRFFSVMAKGVGKALVSSMENGTWPIVLAWATAKVGSLGIKVSELVALWKLRQPAQAVGEGAGEGLGGGLLGKLAGSGIGGKVATWLSEHVGGAGTVTAAGSVGSALGAAVGAGLGLGINFDGFKKQLTDGFSPANFAETTAGAVATGASIGAAFGGPVGAGVGAAVGLAVSGVQTLMANWGPVSQWVSENVGTPLGNAFSGMGKNISKFVSDSGKAWSNFKQDAGDKWTQTKNNFNNQIVNPLKSGLSNVINYFSGNSGKVGDNLKFGISAKAIPVGSAAKNLYNAVKNNIRPAIDNASSWGGSISKKFGSGISSFKHFVSSSASDLKSAAKSHLSGLNSSAHYWGQDLAAGFANGISSGWRWVRNAASNLADLVRAYIHFSTPDVGPLADFDTYAPDMIKTFASGIESSKSLVVSSMNGLASDIRSNIGVGGTVEVSTQSPVSQIANAVALGSVASTGRAANNGPITIQLVVDGQTLARAEWRGEQELSERGIFRPQLA